MAISIVASNHDLAARPIRRCRTQTSTRHARKCREAYPETAEARSGCRSGARVGTSSSVANEIRVRAHDTPTSVGKARGEIPNIIISTACPEWASSVSRITSILPRCASRRSDPPLSCIGDRCQGTTWDVLLLRRSSRGWTNVERAPVAMLLTARRTYLSLAVFGVQ